MSSKRISFNEICNDNYMKFFKFLLDNQFKKLSGDAKILYTILRDRLNLSNKSIKEGKDYWIDQNGDVFIHATKENIMDLLNCGGDKAINLKKELVKFNLIDDVRTGRGKPNKIYLKNVDYLEKRINTLKSENQTSRSRKIRLLEVGKSDPNKNNINKNNINKNNKQYIQEKSNVNTNLEKNQENFVVVEKTALKNNLDLKENKDNTNNKNITKELIEKVKNRYEEVTQEKTTTANIKELLQKTSENTINTYLNNIDNFEINMNRAGFMRKAILGNWSWSDKKIDKRIDKNKPVQSQNYEQRKYDDEFIESLYDNF